MNHNNEGMFMNYVLSSLLKKVSIPGDYHGQVRACKEIGMDDVSGLVDVLTDFAVESASVDYNIETDNENLTKLLKQWLDRINQDYLGIPTGINPLAEEYFKERWKTSSFPILKMAKWEELGASGLIVPTKMFFVDGESIRATDKDEDSDNVKLVNYDYTLGENERLDKNVIITRPFARWTEKYPIPYLIKRGIYHNWKIIKSLKGKEEEILDQIIPYMMLVKKGTEKLYTEKNISYSEDKLKEVITQLQGALDKYNEFDSKKKMMVRATNFDETLEHLIPDLKVIFDPELFAVAEKAILAGLGFVDIAEGTTASRRESILNPKPFIQETKKGVKDFKQIIKELVLIIADRNKKNKKYMASKIRVTSSPVTGFMTDKFKERIRQCWDRGKLSNKTAVEIICEVDFETEVKRREQEAKDGIDAIMYPNVTDNKEGVGFDLPPSQKVDIEDQPDVKTDPVEKKNFKSSVELEGAPFKHIKDLPDKVKKNTSIEIQRIYLTIFNRAFQTYDNDAVASRVAWSVISKIAKKNKKGEWVRKKKKVEGKMKEVILSQGILEESIAQIEDEIVKEAFDMKALTISEEKKKLLSKLNKSKG